MNDMEPTTSQNSDRKEVNADARANQEWCEGMNADHSSRLQKRLDDVTSERFLVIPRNPWGIFLEGVEELPADFMAEGRRQPPQQRRRWKYLFTRSKRTGGYSWSGA
jgi:hypothetical protein